MHHEENQNDNITYNIMKIIKAIKKHYEETGSHDLINEYYDKNGTYKGIELYLNNIKKVENKYCI